MLIGSMSSLTPRFSTQVSPSCSCSSNSNPYCMPEQPPPCTNTRSLRLGLPSPWMRSPTLRAAASVNFRLSVSISLMNCTLRAGLCRRNRGIRLGRRFGLGDLGGRGFPGSIAQGNQFPRYDGARRHFNHAVMDISVDPGAATEHQPVTGEHVSIDGPVHDDVRDLDVALDEAAFAHGERSAVLGVAAHIAVHAAVEMQAARK